MAVSRINIPGQVDRRAARIARSRTAVVRMGKVSAVNADLTVTVLLGGGSFKAYTFAAFAVNDVVAVLYDTDAYWVLGKVRKP